MGILIMDYHYDRVTGEYLGASEKRQDYLSPGEYLEPPAYATRAEPPEVGANQAARWTGTDWEVVVDKRGQVMHNPTTREETTINELGPIPDGWAEGGLPIDYTQVRADQIALIESARSQAENAGFVFAHAGQQWDGGLMSKSRLRETIDGFNAAGTLPAGFFWTDADNNDVEIATLVELDALFDAMSIEMVQRGFAIHAQQRALKQQIAEAPDDVSAIQSIVWSE